MRAERIWVRRSPCVVNSQATTPLGLLNMRISLSRSIVTRGVSLKGQKEPTFLLRQVARVEEIEGLMARARRTATIITHHRSHGNLFGQLLGRTRDTAEQCTSQERVHIRMAILLQAILISRRHRLDRRKPDAEQLCV
jgi:hypothetical protein